MQIQKGIWLIYTLIIITWVVMYAANVLLLTFAAILFAILLSAIGKVAQKATRLPYPLALALALVALVGGLTLIFWLYSPTIAYQTQKLIEELPAAANSLKETLTPYLGKAMLTYQNLELEFSLTNQKIVTGALKVFSFTLGSITSFVIFLLVGLYLAFDPKSYTTGLRFLLPKSKEARIWAGLEHIGHSLRWWLGAKLISMVCIGVLTSVGLWMLGVSLAFILGLLMALLTFIPYVGPILASIPAILIAFAQDPLLAVYVIILYGGIHAAEGYFITPFIEQRTVSLPPALTIMGQVLLVVLVGGLGLALATPLIVVGLAIAKFARSPSTKIANQT